MEYIGRTNHRLSSQAKEDLNTVIDKSKIPNENNTFIEIPTITKTGSREFEHFKLDTDLPKFDSVLNGSGKYVGVLVEMSPKDYLKIQGATRNYTGSWETIKKNYIETKVEQDSLEYHREKLLSDEKLPLLVIELDQNGNLSSFQEGFHRAYAAYLESIESIPVLIARRLYR